MNTTFEIDERLAADSAAVINWALCRVRLMNDRTFPWLILVPARPGLKELHDLESVDRGALMAEISRASRGLSEIYRADKINVGAIGNIVPQLHVHVVARFRNDAAWPKPPWGAVPAEPYSAAELEQALARLRTVLV